MASKRLRHVLKVFSSVGLLSYREKHLPQDQQTTPVKLRQAFEQLGPKFLLKLGKFYRHARIFCQRPISENYQNSKVVFLH